MALRLTLGKIWGAFSQKGNEKLFPLRTEAGLVYFHYFQMQDHVSEISASVLHAHLNRCEVIMMKYKILYKWLNIPKNIILRWTELIWKCMWYSCDTHSGLWYASLDICSIYKSGRVHFITSILISCFPMSMLRRSTLFYHVHSWLVQETILHLGSR